MVSISNYASQIYDAEDRPLFEEAVKSADSGALRAAYIMLWLSCAESLKRKFRDAQKRDGAAGKIVGDIEKREGDQKSVDKFLLDKAKGYGFVSDSSHTILMNIYELRCVYGHPYNEAPTEVQVTHAAAMVVEHVLAQPVQLRHGFGKTLVHSLLHDKHYLDDQATAVETFVSVIIPKIDQKIHGWLLDTYWKDLEEIADDPSLKNFFQRGLWFTQAFLNSVGPVFSEDEWHAKAVAYPKTLIHALNETRLFERVGVRGQDTLVGAALDRATEHSGVLRYLERLAKADALSERQESRFLAHVEEMSITRLQSAKLSTKTCLKPLLCELRSHDWYRQRPAVDMVVANGPAQVAELAVSDRVILGRNILQTADGEERSAKSFLRSLAENPSPWSAPFIRGIVLECFVNEEKQVRLKCNHLKTVLEILGGLDEGVRGKVIERVRNAITKGEPIEVYLGSRRKTPAEVCESLAVYDWAEPMKEALHAMEDRLLPARQVD